MYVEICRACIAVGMLKSLLDGKNSLTTALPNSEAAPSLV